MKRLLLMGMLTLSISGCATKIVVIPADKECVALKENQPFTPWCSGWFVPSAKMLDILNERDRLKIELEHARR